MWTNTICIFTLFFSVLSAYTYGDTFQYGEGVYMHGIVAVIGFGYAAFFALALNERNFPDKFIKYDKFAAIITAMLIFSLIIHILLRDNMLAKYILTSIVAVHIVFLVFLSLKINLISSESFFSLSACLIGITAWSYFIYASYFQYFFFFKTKLSYSMLALSFPFSLIAFSRISKLIALPLKVWLYLLIILVSSVLIMFLGMLAKNRIVEGVFAIILILWIGFFLVKTYKNKNSFLPFTILGLFITGLLGVVTFLKTGIDGVQMASAASSSKNALIWHAHAAYMLWALIAYYLIYFDIKSFSKYILFSFLLPLLVTFISVGVYNSNNNIIFLHLASFSFAIMTFFVYKRSDAQQTNKAV